MCYYYAMSITKRCVSRYNDYMNRQPATFIISVILVVIILVGGYYVVSHMRYQTVAVQTTSGSLTSSTIQVSTMQVSIGQTGTGTGVTLTPLEVMDDSRCPKGVTCVWAGTVHVRARVQNEVGTGEVTFELGKPVTLGGENVALIAVAPDKTQSAIPASTYRFTFMVTNK